MTSVNDDNVPATRSEELLTDGKYLIADDALVEPLDIDGQRPVSLQMFTEVPPHGLQGTILTLKETEPTEPNVVVFESYLASKSTRVKGGPEAKELPPGQSSSAAIGTQPCFVSSNVIPQKVVLTMPTSGVVDPQRGQVGLRSVRPPLGNQFAADSTLSAARKVRPACDLALHGQVPASRVVTLVGKSGVLPNEIRQNIRQVGDTTILKVPIQAGLQPKSAQSISGLLKNYGLQPSGTGSKVSRTPNIFARRGCAKKPPGTSQPLSLVTSSSSSPTMRASPVFQVAMTMPHAVARPKMTSTVVRSQFVASNSQGLVVNPPGTVTSAAIIPSVSSFGFDAANNSKLLRFASPRNVSLAPVGTLTLSGTSPKVGVGAVRFPAPSLAGTTASLPRPVLASSIAKTLIPPQRTTSPLTSFRMQNARNTLKSGTGFSSVQNAIPQVLAEVERPSLKRKAPAIEAERPAKRRRLLSGREYNIELPDGKKLTGVWDNGMIRSVASPAPSDGKIVDNSAVEKDAVQVATQLNDDGACSNVGGEGCKSLSSPDVKLKMMETADGGGSRFYICMTCKTVRSQNVPCGTCNAMPQPCIYRPGSEKTNKLPANTAHLQTPADAVLQQQVAVNAGQPKALNRIVMMQGPASRQFHLTRRPIDQAATSSPAVRLGLPIQLHPTMAALGSGIQRTPTPRIMRKKTNVQKRPEPDVVQILSSDDEDSHALESGNGSQTGALPSVSSSSVAAPPSVATQETQETCPEPMNAPASIENHLFTIKIRLVRFGTLQKATVVESSFYVDGIKIVFFKDDVIDSSSLYIPVADLRVVRVHYGPCGPVFFLHATSGVAVRLREIFRMSVQGHIFDPEHKDDACRFITIIPDKNQVVAEAFVTAMIEKMQGSCLTGHKFTVQTINGEVASQLLKAKLSAPVTEVPTMNINATQKVIFITANGQIIQRHIVGGAELAGQTLMVRPMEGEEEEELADRSRSPSPPHPTFIGPIVRLFTYPPPPATGGIAVSNEDFFCLKDGEYLNDVIIDFYLKYLLREVLNKEDHERTHVFSSFFYRRLMQKQAGKHSDEANMTLQQLRHSRVRTWTRHVDLFSKDFIIVPINESAHWYLAIICFPGLGGIISADNSKQEDTNLAAGDGGSGDMDTSSIAENSGATEETQTASQDSSRMETDCPKKEKKPCILIFDSLAMPTRYGVVRTLREYLQTEWDVKKKTCGGLRNFNKDNMQGACPRCPRQTNYSDCGVYVLQYVESFFKDPIPDFTLPITTLANWFSEEVIVSKRDSLRQLVLRLQKGLNPELEYDPCQNSVDSLTSGSNLQLMSSSANTTAAAEKLPGDPGSDPTPAVSGISESPENCASDKQKNGDLGDESSTCADSLMSADVNSSEPAVSNHSVVAPNSSSPQENSISTLSQTAVMMDSKANICSDYTSNPEGSTASDELEKATVSNEEQPGTDCTDTNSAARETSLDSAATVDCREFSALKLSDQNNVKVSEAGVKVSILGQQQPLPVNVGRTPSKETSYVAEFSSWLSKRSHKSVEDDGVSNNAATGLSESCPAEEQTSSSVGGQKMDPENSCHPSQDVSCSEKMDVDSDSFTGISSSSSAPAENSSIPLRDEHLETGLLSTVSSSVEQSSQNEVDVAASSCTNVLNAECSVNDQMPLEDGQV